MELKLKEDLLAENDRIAQQNKELLAQEGVFAFELVGGPGAGKTALLEQILAHLASEYRIAVIEGDLYTSKDAERLARYQSKVVQINTKGACHLEALSIQKTLAELDLANLDCLIIENVGNLVCTAAFAVGTTVTITLLSIPEGNDKPFKYPALFEESTAVVINKIDLLTQTNFSLSRAEDDLRTLNPELEIFPLSSTKGEGVKEFCGYLSRLIADE